MLSSSRSRPRKRWPSSGRPRPYAAALGRLPPSKGEIEAIASEHRVNRRDEPVELWGEQDASEARLKALPRPPRVLHLATHGFYRAADRPQDRPMLLAGVALADANLALREVGEDGILYAIEAQGLNLEGTELVVLSACETAQGQIDYAEGVSGLVRAFRTAGARYVLVALRPVGDQGASTFIQRFYHHWLAQTQSDPAAALRAARPLTAIAPSRVTAAGHSPLVPKTVNQLRLGCRLIRKSFAVRGSKFNSRATLSACETIRQVQEIRRALQRSISALFKRARELAPREPRHSRLRRM